MNKLNGARVRCGHFYRRKHLCGGRLHWLSISRQRRVKRASSTLFTPKFWRERKHALEWWSNGVMERCV